MALTCGIISWIGASPKLNPAGLSPEADAALPEKLRGREIRVITEQKSFHSRTLDIVTAFFDADLYTPAAIAALYRRRRTIELSFRHIKSTLGMGVLRTRAPEMAKKEVLVYLVAYNLIQSLLWGAKRLYRIDNPTDQFQRRHAASFQPGSLWINRASPSSTKSSSACLRKAL
jgi:hypothetical protein